MSEIVPGAVKCIRTPNDTLRLKIRCLMGLKKLTQERAAKLIGISRISLNRFLVGKTQLRANEFLDLIYLIGVDIDPQLEDRIRELHDAGRV